MRQIPLIILIAILIAACTPIVSKESSIPDHDVTFHCDNGETFGVRFYTTRELAVLVRNGDEIELPQQRSGSGFIYSNGSNTIRGKGDNLTVEIGRMMPIECVAK